MENHSLFENVQIDPETLPKINNLDFQPLESSYLKVLIIGNAIFSLFLLVGITLFVVLNKLPYPAFVDYLIYLFTFTLIGFIFYVIIRGFKNKGYALREKDIAYKSGLWWKSLISIPFNRVQHCEVKQGPIERFYDLSQLVVYTAGGSQSDLSIPGLSQERSQTLKRFILSQTVLDEEE